MAAVELAASVGATTVGTAGGPPKRGYLRGLGVRAAASSRATDFATDLFSAGAAPVDVVLNSLTSPGAPAPITPALPPG